MSAIIATDSEAEQFLHVLSEICGMQKVICSQLDELVLLMQLPSEDVLRVLSELLIPMDQEMGSLHLAVLAKFLEPQANAGEG